MPTSPRLSVATNPKNSSSKDNETAEHDSSKRTHHNRSKFSIQKFIRHGLLSWRKRRKASSSSPSPVISAPNSPPLSTGRFVNNSGDLSQTLPVEPMRSLSLDLPENDENLVHQSSVVLNIKPIELDPSLPNNRIYIPSPWTHSSKELTSIKSPSLLEPISTGHSSKITPSGTNRTDGIRLPISSNETNLPSSTSTSTTNGKNPIPMGTSEKFTANQFQPIDDTRASVNRDKLSSSTPIYTEKGSSNASSSSSPPMTTKQITIEEIDTNRYEEIPAKEPDLNRQPEKSALKKPNGVKRRVIPVLRENQRPSPRPSPKLDSSKFHPIQINATQPDSDGNSSSSDEDDDDDDDDENENEEKRFSSKRFANVQRNDSLARYLNDRSASSPIKPVEERKNERETIETKLERKLSLRPKPEDLQARNILRAKTAAELNEEKEEKKRYLIRKLSFRPSIQELRDRKIIRFCDYIEMSECDDVDRRGEKPWTRLTPRDKQLIRRELNEYKSSEMEIHPESTKYTRFHPP